MAQDFNSMVANVQRQIHELQNYKFQQQQPTTTPRSNKLPYPINTSNPKCVEDIIANPEWRDELLNEFSATDKARDITARMKKLSEESDLEFLVFCENKTRFQSTALEKLRTDYEANKAKETTPIKGEEPSE